MATYPVYPATTFTQAVELTIFASNQLHDVINGDALTTVETENGDIPTLRKALVDNLYFKTPIDWVEGESTTVFNQLYYFEGTLSTSGWYYAPQATPDNPIAMGSTPSDDDNWRLYETVAGLSAKVHTANAAAVAAENAAAAATVSAEDAQESAAQAKSYITGVQLGIVSYATTADLLAAVPTSDQLGLAMDTDKLYHYITASLTWVDLNVTFSDYMENISNLDKALNSTETTWEDTSGTSRLTWRGIEDKNDELIEDTRQNLIPLSRQYMTLAAAQADIANIPEGSTTYYRSPDDSALAIEVINNAGTLTATGRKIPSYSFVEKLPTLGKSGDHPNLVNFDDNDLEVGKRLSVTTGQAEPLAGYNTTGWIPVTPGQQLVFSVLGEIANFYSENKTFISGSGQASRYVTVPAGASWMRASYQPSMVYWIVDGAILPPSVSPYGLVVNPEHIQSVPLKALPTITPEYMHTFQRSGTNLFNKNSRLQGYYISEYGTPIASTQYDASAMIKVEPGKTYTSNAFMRFVTMYGAGGAPIKEASITANTKMFTVPAGIAGVRVSIAVSAVATFALTEGTATPAYTEFKWIAPSSLPDGTPVEYMPKINDGAVSRAMIASEAVSPDKTNLFTASKNIFLADTVTNGYYVNNNTGLLAENATYSTSDYIPVKPSTTYTARVKGGRGARTVAFYVDANTVIAPGVDAPSGDIYTFTTPANAKFMRLSPRTVDVALFQVQEGDTATDYEAPGFTAKTEIDGIPITWPTPDIVTTEVRPSHYGLERLRETRQRLRSLKYGKSGTTARLVVGLVGDSWTHNTGRYALKVATSLWRKYHASSAFVVDGPIGRGFCSFGGIGSSLPNGDVVWNNRAVIQAGTADVSAYGTGNGPDACQAVLPTGTIIRYQGNETFSKGTTFTLFAEGGAGVIRHSWDGGVTWQESTDLSALPVGLQTILLAGKPESGKGQFWIEAVSGPVTLYGVNEELPDVAGVLVHKLGATGTRVQQWASIDATHWKAGIASLGLNLLGITHGTNDQTPGRSKAQYKADILTLIDRAREANPYVDILLVAPAENQRTNNPIAMSVYADALYEIARDERNVAYLDLQQWFGENPADYAANSGRPWFASDLIHPDPDMGGYVIADAWLFALGELSS